MKLAVNQEEWECSFSLEHANSTQCYKDRDLKCTSDLMFDYYISFRNQTSVGSIGCWIGPLISKPYSIQGGRTRCEGVEIMFLKRFACFLNRRMGNINRERVP